MENSVLDAKIHLRKKEEHKKPDCIRFYEVLDQQKTTVHLPPIVSPMKINRKQLLDFHFV